MCKQDGKLIIGERQAHALPIMCNNYYDIVCMHIIVVLNSQFCPFMSTMPMNLLDFQPYEEV